MTTEVLRKKTARYLSGIAVPSESRQIQTWLSCTSDKAELPANDRQKIEDDIVAQVMAYVESTQVYLSKSETWWRKITASF